jgi:hypothetical protein
MPISAKVLRRIATLTVAMPILLSLAAQAVMWVIPGCLDNRNAVNECRLVSVDIAGILLFFSWGGFISAFFLSVVVSVPLFAISLALSFWDKRR